MVCRGGGSCLRWGGAPMIGTFASELEHFARSVDIVDDATFDRVRALIYQYIRREFRDIYFELQRRHFASNGHGHEWLETFWSSTDQNHNWAIRTSDDAGSPYLNAVTAAFGMGNPLWLTSQDEEHPRLSGAQLQDEWSGLEDLPPYQPTDRAAATAVVIPLSSQTVPGVLFLECTRRIRRTEVATGE